LEDAKKLLQEWRKSRVSVWASVGASVWDSVGASVWDYVWDYVRVSVVNSVRVSVWASDWDSVWYSVWAYISSLFTNIEHWKYVNHKEGVNPFQSCIDLWKGGYVPSFDGMTWRLHTKDGIVWEDV
jgi:hypothetical protein